MMAPPTNAEHCRRYYAANREKLLAQKREHYEEHHDELIARGRANYAKHKEKRIEYAREYRRRNRERLNAEALERYQRNREARLEQRKGYRKANAAKIYARIQAWRKRNPDKEFLYHAKRVLAEATGMRVADIPDDIAQAKVEQLKITRWIREQLARRDGDT